ncbi:hypothetical protein GGI09_008159, partial [Coemansia sp. S100]
MRARSAAPQPEPIAAPKPEPVAGAEEYKLPPVCYRPLFAAGHPKYTTTIDDVPAFLRDRYVISGYRRLCYSYTACLRSMTYVNNESGNVLTHLASLFIFVGLA